MSIEAFRNVTMRIQYVHHIESNILVQRENSYKKSILIGDKPIQLRV